MIIRVFSFFLFFSFLSGCQNNIKDNKPSLESSTVIFKDSAMTIPYKIIIGKNLSVEEKDVVSDIIRKTFDEINAIYNKWNPQSELSRLNRIKADVVVNISLKLERLLKQAEMVVLISKGRFDPTIEPLQQLWKQKLEKGQVPSKKEIEAIIPAIGWDKVHIGNGLFYKDHDATQLDLGGIAKGYGVDLLTENLNANGFSDVFIEWGGEIRASGKHPEGRSWHTFISRLSSTDPDEAIAHLDLHDQSIATSGDYLQNWTVRIPEASVEEGTTVKTYFHIFDPHSYQPLVASRTTVASSSVLAPTCALADGLATAAMMFPTIEESEKWAKSLSEAMPELTFWIISRERAQQ